jgi:hypothetical protein
MTWVFIILFPLLLGGQVEVRVKATNEAHCNRVRNLLVQQLDDHRSNATVLPCEQASK